MEIKKEKTAKKLWHDKGLVQARKGVLTLGFFTLIVGVFLVAYVAAYARTIVPGVKIVGIEVGNMKAEEAAGLIERKINQKNLPLILVVSGEQKWEIKAEDVGAKVNLPKTVANAWLVGRKGGVLERLGEAQRSYFQGINFELAIEVEEEKWNQKIAEIAGNINEPEIQTSLMINEGKVTLVPGKDGLKVDEYQLKERVLNRWSSLNESPVEVPVKEIKVGARQEESERAIKLAESLLGKKLTVTIDQEKWILGESELIGMISVAQGGVDREKIAQEMQDFVMGVNREPQNAAFQFVNNKVEEFRPGKDGLKVIEDKFTQEIEKGIQNLAVNSEWTIGVPVERIAPAISTGEVNDLGIEKLIGVGESTYLHSIPNRVHNVALAANRISGVLVPPGEVFSFNQALGEVSQATGFKSAYVISGGRTILGDGGGVCQVSTTLFRAALDTGLPIVERKAHAYRVGYYEQDSLPGVDATVYSPTVDFKFLNNTPGHILVQAIVDTSKLYLKFEVYGTDDGRTVKLSEPKVWGQVGAPPAVYQDDPTLPVGVTKQIDWAAAGAKASFEYQVMNKDGQIMYENTFYSNYRPWQAVYLRGTKVN